MWETSRIIKKHSVSKFVLTFHCLNKLFYWFQRFCKFLVFSLEFQIFFSITRRFFLTVGQNNFGKKIQHIFWCLLSNVKASGISFPIFVGFLETYIQKTTKCAATWKLESSFVNLFTPVCLLFKKSQLPWQVY